MVELVPAPVFVVLRAARGVPPGWMPAHLEGRWYNRADLLKPTLEPLGGLPPAAAVAIPTTRLEHRDDGATAQVWEVHPPDGNYANDDPDPGP